MSFWIVSILVLCFGILVYCVTMLDDKHDKKTNKEKENKHNEQ